jgi:tetratricopeptide (TPR) repeat protein
MLGEVPAYLVFEEVVAKTDRPGGKTNFKRQLETRARAAVLLSEYYAWIHRNSNEEDHFKRAVACMEAAIDTQRQLIDGLRAAYKRVDAERKTLADLHYQLMSLLSTRCSDLNTILPSIEDAIKNDPENLTYHLISGRTHLSMGNIDLAKEKAKQIFKSDFRHPEAILLFADCLLRANQVDSGLKGFQKIFEKDLAANNSTFSLTALVWFHREAGTLPDFLKLLAKHSRALPEAPADRTKARSHPTGGNDPHLSYCYGVYFYSIRNFNAAIEELAKCRNTPILAGPVAVLLADIYLHSNAFNLYSNFLQKEKFRTIPKLHLEIARGIVDDLTDPDYATEKEVLSLVIQSFLDQTRLPDAIKGLEALLSRPAAESNQSMILYYLAVLYLRSKEKDRLKDIFHSMKELPFRPKRCFDEYYFRASMLCVDTLLFKDKAKPAKALIDKCVGLCKGCLLSYDYLIVHNERAKESCVDILRTAFQITNNEDPNLGYKLARDLMTENRPHESFQVCKTVLAKHPKFRQIETEVLLRVKEDLLSNC